MIFNEATRVPREDDYLRYVSGKLLSVIGPAYFQIAADEIRELERGSKVRNTKSRSCRTESQKKLDSDAEELNIGNTNGAKLSSMRKKCEGWDSNPRTPKGCD